MVPRIVPSLGTRFGELSAPGVIWQRAEPEDRLRLLGGDGSPDSDRHDMGDLTAIVDYGDSLSGCHSPKHVRGPAV